MRRGFLLVLAKLFGRLFGGRAKLAGAAFKHATDPSRIISPDGRRLNLPPGATAWLRSSGDGTWEVVGWRQGEV